jgi:alpha-glucosidase
MGYSFELLVDDFSAAYIRQTVSRLEAAMVDGWPCWAISNHDVPRAVSRWGGAGDDDFAAQLVALVCSLRGSVCLYQGEELGLSEADVPFELLQDPYGKTFWPNFKGRDGCRTPLPWRDAQAGGFTTGQPWLPVPDEHRSRSVAAQEADDASVLQHVRRFLAWRRQFPALVCGRIQFLQTEEPVLAFIRQSEGQRLLVVFNLSAQTQTWTLPAGLAGTTLDSHGLRSAVLDAGTLTLPARGSWFGQLT